jgi:hypothetical protein
VSRTGLGKGQAPASPIYVVPASFLSCKKLLTLGTALFWDITQRRVVILYRRFRTTSRSQLQSSLQQNGGSLKSRSYFPCLQPFSTTRHVGLKEFSHICSLYNMLPPFLQGFQVKVRWTRNLTAFHPDDLGGNGGESRNTNKPVETCLCGYGRYDLLVRRLTTLQNTQTK